MTQRYILMPVAGESVAAAQRLRELNRQFERESLEQEIDGVRLRVVDANRDGPALVEMKPDDVETLRRNGSPVQAVLEVFYPYPLPNELLDSETTERTTEALPAGRAFTVICLDDQGGAPLRGLVVKAVCDGAPACEVRVRTDARGKARLTVPEGRQLRRLQVVASSGYWGASLERPPLRNQTLRIARINLAEPDVVRHYYPADAATKRFDPSTGVTVGVIDSGVAGHAALNLGHVRCLVTGIRQSETAHVGDHGTHVAGLIGASGQLTALAPGVRIHSYRVFEGLDSGASSFAIGNALMRASLDGCDIVNLSLGTRVADHHLSEAICAARHLGMLIVVAAGNDASDTVSYPAACEGAFAVSAMGRRGTYPSDAQAAGDYRDTPASRLDPDEFIATFSNSGAEIAVTAPGVGVLSTLPDGGYGPLSGTSMAAPVVAGVAACLLSKRRDIYAMERDQARAAAIEQLVRDSCVLHGFGELYEGSGRPQA